MSWDEIDEFTKGTHTHPLTPNIICLSNKSSQLNELLHDICVVGICRMKFTKVVVRQKSLVCIVDEWPGVWKTIEKNQQHIPFCTELKELMLFISSHSEINSNFRILWRRNGNLSNKLCRVFMKCHVVFVCSNIFNQESIAIQFSLLSIF